MTDGHPQNTVNVSTFVPEGYVWVGTEPGDEVGIATQLLAAAGENYGAVMAQSGGFLVPSDVAIAAGLAQPPAPEEVAEAPAEAPAEEAPAEAPVQEAPVEAPVEEAPVETPAPAPAKKGAKAAAADTSADAPAAS